MQHPTQEHEIPQEIWLYIFHLATVTSTYSRKSQVTEYRPFQPPGSATGLFWWNQKTSFDTKRAIVLVCKAWRVLAMEVMFEEIRIRHSTKGLLKGLERSSQELGVDGYARWVRRIMIDPVILDFDVFNPVGIPPILTRCTSAEMIIRPMMMAANPPLSKVRSEFPILPSVKRVDWWLASAGPHTQNSNPWSSDFLSQVLQNSPNLQYLTISGDRMPLFTSPHVGDTYPPATVSLPSLITLCVDHKSLDPLFAGTTFECPNLHTFVMGSAISVCRPFLVANGARLKIVEISRPHVDMDAQAFVNPILADCPNLRELYLYINQPPGAPNAAPFTMTHQNLKCIGIRTAEADAFWGFIGLHGEILRGFSLPALERVVVDATEWAILDASLVTRLPVLEEDLRRRSCVLELITSLGAWSHEV
jgi:hypothetical protein